MFDPVCGSAMARNPAPVIAEYLCRIKVTHDYKVNFIDCSSAPGRCELDVERSP